METPIVRCPRCDHPINHHTALAPCCECKMDPNLIAVALLFGDLTPPPTSISRQPDGSWA